MSAPRLQAEFSVTVGHGGREFSLDVSLHLDRGTLVLFGPSGAGKSLTLRGLAGLLRPRTGRVTLGDEVMFDGATGDWIPPHL
ncbi:MAG: ATP-binding cassette domain-containing protein, partial [Myxococcota bacterium]|nr:ATP-binding cassette domain-containing protein [Myxococcota bacterium]